VKQKVRGIFILSSHFKMLSQMDLVVVNYCRLVSVD
jgi:hypothetical protein